MRDLCVEVLSPSGWWDHRYLLVWEVHFLLVGCSGAWVHACKSSNQEMVARETSVQGQPLQYSKFEPSLGYKRPCLQNQRVLIILSFEAQKGFILYYIITHEFYHLLESNVPLQNEGGPGAFYRFHGVVQCQHSGTFYSFPGSWLVWLSFDGSGPPLTPQNILPFLIPSISSNTHVFIYMCCY